MAKCIKHVYKQKYKDCAIAAIASIIHDLDPKVTYKDVRRQALKHFNIKFGLHNGYIAKLCLMCGFQNAIIMTGDIEIFDFQWQKYSNKKIIQELFKVKNTYVDKDSQKCIQSYIDFLRCDNTKIIIDSDYKKHIINEIDKHSYIILCYNWNIFFKKPKHKVDNVDPIHGDADIHAVIAYDYNNKGVFVLDSNCLSDDYPKRYHGQRYMMEWEKLLVSISMSDVIIPYNYINNKFNIQGEILC